MVFAHISSILASLGLYFAFATSTIAQESNSASGTRVPPIYWENFEARSTLRTAPGLTQTCNGPGTTPLCAFKTWVTCLLYDRPELCAAVGAPTITKQYPDPAILDAVLLAQPWTLPLDEIMREAFAFELYDGGIVPADRFTATLYGGQRLEPEFQEKVAKVRNGGVAELVADVPQLDFLDSTYQLSFFFQKTGENWHLSGWRSSRNGVCSSLLAPPGWGPCAYHLPHLMLRDTLSGKHKFQPLWKSPKGVGIEEYQHMGVDLRATAGKPAVAVMAGKILRRLPVYLDTPNFDWVVLDAATEEQSLIIKYAFVDSSGPAVGTMVDAGAPLGVVQDLSKEHPGTDHILHFETVLDDAHVDPMSILPRKSP